MKKPFVVSVLMSLMLSAEAVFAQDFNFNILPLAINPAFTGLFDGKLRASGLYKHQWSTSKPPFTAYGGSADGAVLVRRGGYLALGAGALESRIGGGVLDNFSCIASVAYHKIFRSANSKNRSDLAGGVQGGYIHRSINLPGFRNTAPPFVYRIGGGAEYFIVNAGLSFSQSFGKRFAYTIGLSGNNLNLLNDGTVQERHPLLRVTPSGTALVSANWAITDRVVARPALLHIINQDFYVGGSEIRYGTCKSKPLRTAFVGVWYRTGDVLSVNPGYEFGSFRLSAGMDFFLSHHNGLNDGGVQVVARYIMPRQKKASAGAK